jgi:hypothetical protein
MTTYFDEAGAQREVDHARSRARAIIVDYLFDSVDVMLASQVPEELRERTRDVVIAVSYLRDDLIAWAMEER